MFEHQPDSCLIKFNKKEHTEKTISMTYLTHHHDIVIHVGLWRSLSHTLGVALFLRVLLCLEHGVDRADGRHDMLA